MNEFTLEQLSVGVCETQDCPVTVDDIERFAQLSGDHSTIHFDDEYARGRGFKERLVHGLYVGALVSGFIGMRLPGKHGLLQSVNLQFRKPCYAPNRLSITGRVARTSLSTKTVVIDLTVLDDNADEIVRGIANSVLKL